MNIKDLTITDAQKGLRVKDFSPDELRREFLKLIKKEDKDLHAYLCVFDGDEQVPLAYDMQNALYGVPCAVKDVILIKDTVTTAGSKILQNYIAAYDATVTQHLKKAGAVFLGKTNLDEFAMGSSTENSAFGPTKNPHDLERVPGGSSGGSAAAVAAGLAVFGLGSDTGGSIRQPASLCGVVGLKPTYGRVSRNGLIAMASSLDQIGPLTKTVTDAALVMNVIAGKDPLDSTTVDIAVPDFTRTLGQSIKGLKFGVPKEYFGKGLDEDVNVKIQAAIAKLERLGAEPVGVSLPHSEYALAAYYLIMPSEVSANLARFDGIRYGYSKDAPTLRDVYLFSRSGGFGAEAKRRIMLGTYALSAGYYDAYYLKAQKVRTLIRRDFEEVFKEVDVIIGPTSPTVAFKIGEKADDPLSMYLSDIYTVAINLAGLPGISIPCGTVDRDGKKLPVGLQIVGRSFDEETILKAAYAFENDGQPHN